MTKPSAPRPRKPRENRWAFMDWGPTDHVCIYPLGSRHMNAKQCRVFASWLLRAADWLDAQAQPPAQKPGAGARRRR